MLLSNKLTSVLATLTPIEMNQLSDWVHSPYHNKNLDTINLFKILKKSYPEFNISKEDVYKKLYSGKEYDDLKLRHIMSNLLKIVEDYMIYKKINENEFQIDITLLAIYNEKQLEVYYNNLKEKMLKDQAKTPFRGIRYYLEQYQLESEISKNIERQKNRSIEPNFQELSDNLDIYYIINKLKLYCAVNNYRNIVDKEYNIGLMEDILKHIDYNKYGHIPIINIYRNALLTLVDFENESHFNTLYQLLIDNIDSFPSEEAVDMFVLAKNYCIKKVNNGHDKFYSIIFNLYKLEIEKNIMNVNEYISPFSYKNIISVALQLKEFEWTNNFINEFTSKLAPQFRDNMFSFNSAKYCFATKQYKQVIKLLATVEYDEMFLYLDSKVILLKTFYELKDFDPLYSLVDSFRMYLKRKKTLSYHSQLYLNFIKILKKVTKIDPGDIKRIEEQIEEINAIGKFVGKDWLLEKLEELRHFD